MTLEVRFCPQCGTRIGEQDTRVLETPPDETGAVPVEVMRVEPRLYGVTPSALVLGLAVASLILTIVFFATGHWPVALIMLGLTVSLNAHPSWILLFGKRGERQSAGRRHHGCPGRTLAGSKRSAPPLPPLVELT